MTMTTFYGFLGDLDRYRNFRRQKCDIRQRRCPPDFCGAPAGLNSTPAQFSSEAHTSLAGALASGILKSQLRKARVRSRDFPFHCHRVRVRIEMTGALTQVRGPASDAEVAASACHALASFDILYPSMPSSGGRWDGKTFSPE